METCCGYQYDLARKLLLPVDFPGPSRAHRSGQHCPPLPVREPPLRLNHFQGRGLLARKDNSSQGPCRRLHIQLRCRAEKKSVSRCRNLDRLPSRSTGCAPHRVVSSRVDGFNLLLRLDSPMANCCRHGTFPHFSLQSSHLNICYYHQDLH